MYICMYIYIYIHINIYIYIYTYIIVYMSIHPYIAVFRKRLQKKNNPRGSNLSTAQPLCFVLVPLCSNLLAVSFPDDVFFQETNRPYLCFHTLRTKAFAYEQTMTDVPLLMFSTIPFDLGDRTDASSFRLSSSLELQR